MYPPVGIIEVVLSCVVGLIGLGLPVAILVLLYMIYNKVKTIEEMLNKE